MNAPHKFQTAATSWHDMLAQARAAFPSCPYLAVIHIERLHQEAEALAAKHYADWRVHTAIADACEAFIDCPCTDCLDELQVLMADDTEAEELAQHSRAYRNGDWSVSDWMEFDAVGRGLAASRSTYGMGGGR